MRISATYLCPVRGLTLLEPPEPLTLLKAAGTAKALGVEALLLPVLEESLLGPSRSRVRVLDGLVMALDRASEAGISSRLIAPASRVLGLDWAPPYLLKGSKDPAARPVFVDGELRHLRPLDWWRDPPLIQKRIATFRELVSAVSGHPGLQGWVLLDRSFEWVRPEADAAEFILRSFLAEIRERDETATTDLGLGWSDLLAPEPALRLAGLVDGLFLSGIEKGLPGLSSFSRLDQEVILASCLGAMAQWLFGKSVDVEIGWGLLHEPGDPEEIMENLGHLVSQGVSGVHWLSLADPQPGLRREPPWGLSAGSEKAGLLDQYLEPKEGAEAWIKTLRSTARTRAGFDFIDVDREEYISDPQLHLPRLWENYRESRS
ncbi:MAG: hypothetical protein JXL84_13560 [Deltaproteobacteria bacterium]|nr:hypothetical protein [Deltaproteobacteria bacterium]